MATKDVLDLDLDAREGLEKLGYTQEMTRVRVVESSSFLVWVDDASRAVRRHVAWSIFFSVGFVRRVLSRSRAHCCCCSLAVTLGSSHDTTDPAQELTCR